MFALRNLCFVLVIVLTATQSSWASVIGDSCTSGCDGGMVCNSGRCACPRDNVENAAKTRCLPVAAYVGGGCELQAQCTAKLSNNTVCLDFKCTCQENAAVVNNVCEKKRELDDSCSLNQQCQSIHEAKCERGVCVCNERFVPHSTNKTSCLPIATSFETDCEEDIQCSKGIGDRAFCRDGKCQCIEGYHGYQAFTPQCVENKGLEESCMVGECHLPLDMGNQNIECAEGKCACKNEVSPSQDKQSCSGSAGLRSFGLLSALWLIVLGVSRV